MEYSRLSANTATYDAAKVSMIESPASTNLPEFKPDDSRVSVGRFTYGCPRLMLWGESERISIGAFCSISDQVTIFGGGEHRLDWVTTYPLRVAFNDEQANLDGHPSTKGQTIIGNDVWIGFNATIMSGVQIGNGSVVGACSVVSKDVPPYAVVAGNPAKVVKYRFSREEISALQSIKWWDWEDEKIKSSMKLLCSDNVDEFIKKFKFTE